MIKDPTDQFIKYILENCDIKDKIILEVGCGDGRITKDLSKYAKKVVAIDPDNAKLQKAKSEVVRGNVDFKNMKGEILDFPKNSFNFVVYGLSLHHITHIKKSLMEAAEVLKPNGNIIVIEPYEGGTLIEAEEKFGVGDGNERDEKKAALSAIESLEGWTVSKGIFFQTLFHFDDEEDFFRNLLPNYHEKTKELKEEIKKFLIEHKNGDKIILDAERRMNVLSRQE